VCGLKNREKVKIGKKMREKWTVINYRQQKYVKMVSVRSQKSGKSKNRQKTREKWTVLTWWLSKG
jgi:hypothetical protein